MQLLNKTLAIGHAKAWRVNHSLKGTFFLTLSRKIRVWKNERLCESVCHSMAEILTVSISDHIHTQIDVFYFFLSSASVRLMLCVFPHCLFLLSVKTTIIFEQLQLKIKHTMAASKEKLGLSNRVCRMTLFQNIL